jgi:hypothetical protein
MIESKFCLKIEPKFFIQIYRINVHAINLGIISFEFDGVRISLHSCHPYSVYQCTNSSKKSMSGVKSVFLGLMLS